MTYFAETLRAATVFFVLNQVFNQVDNQVDNQVYQSRSIPGLRPSMLKGVACGDD